MRIRHSHSDEHSSPFPSSLVPFTIPVLISVILVILTSTTCLGPMLATTAPIPMPLPQPQSMLILPATESRSHSSRPGGNPNTNGQLVRVRLQSTEDTRLMRRIANDFGADIWSSREILLNRTNFQPVNPPRRPRRRRRLPTRLNAPWVRPSNRPTRPTGGGVRPGSDRPLPASRPNLIRRSYQSARQPYPPPTRDERQDVQKSISPAASPQPIEIPSSVPPPLARIYQQQGLTFGGEVDLLVRGDLLDRLQAMFPQVEFHTIIRNVSKAIEETHRDVPWKLPVAEPAKTPCVDVPEVAAPDRVGDGDGGSGTGVGCKCGRGCRSASRCTVSDGAPAATGTGNVNGGGEAEGVDPPIATSGGGNGPTITDEGSPPPTQTVDASSSLTVSMVTATSNVSTAAQTDGPAPTPSNRTDDDGFFATRPTATPTNGDSVVDDDGFVDWTDPIIRPNDPITPDDVDSPPRLFPPGSDTSSLPSDGLRPTISQVGSTISKSATPIMSTARSTGPTSASATYTSSAAGTGTLPPTPTGSSTGSLTAIGSSSTQTGTSVGSSSPGGSATTKTGSIGASSSSTGSFPSSMPRGATVTSSSSRPGAESTAQLSSSSGSTTATKSSSLLTSRTGTSTTSATGATGLSSRTSASASTTSAASAPTSTASSSAVATTSPSLTQSEQITTSASSFTSTKTTSESTSASPTPTSPSTSGSQDLTWTPVGRDFNVAGRYMPLSDMTTYLTTMAQRFPHLVTVGTIGRTFEGRPLVWARLTAPVAGDTPETMARMGASMTLGNGAPMRKTNRPALLITSGMHSREWIATAMAVNLLDVWTAGYGSNQLVTDLLNGFEIIFVPMVNPDGYNESFKSRLWRKNMQLFAGDCVGVDLNRNFPTDEWSDPQDFWASSPDPCDETFRGPAPGSAPETQALMALVREYQSKTGGMMKIFIDTHSYSQLWMFPTGYDCYSEYPELQELFDVSALATETILGVHGKEYYYGDICNTIYPASGSATDWMFAKANIRYSFALELRDTGDHGFLLPPEEIVHTVEEMHAGILAAVAGFISRHPSAAPAAAPVPASPVPIADTAPVAA